MKQVSKTQNSLLHTSGHYSTLSMTSLSKYIFLFLSGLITLLVSSCKKYDLQDNSQSPEMISSDAKKAGTTRCVPFKASFNTIDELTQLPTDENPIQKDHLTGTGVGTLIGRATEETFAEGDVTLPFPALVTSTTTFIAANGDKIFATNDGYLQEPADNGDLRLSGNGTITGGTGRFAGATGNFLFEVTGNIFKPEGTVTFTGKICY